MLTSERLREIRLEERNLSQKEFAEYLGVTSTSVARWERGEVPIPSWLDLLLRVEAQLAAREEQLKNFQEEVKKLRVDNAKLYQEMLRRKPVRKQQTESNRLHFENKRLRQEVKTLREKLSLLEAQQILLKNKQSPSSSQFVDPDLFYKRLALKFHPDRDPKNAEVMKDINQIRQELQRDAQPPH